MSYPVDWDHESHCIEEGCRQPASHERLLAVHEDGTTIVELVCCTHAQVT